MMVLKHMKQLLKINDRNIYGYTIKKYISSTLCCYENILNNY